LGKAENEYRQFVIAGVRKESIWAEVKGEVLLGGAAFVEGLIDHLRKHKDIPEIPKSQRFGSGGQVLQCYILALPPPRFSTRLIARLMLVL